VLPPNPTHAPRGGGAWREDVVIERIAAELRAAFPTLDGQRFGDDAAVVDHAGSSLLLCTDASVEGVHVDTALFPESDLGYRATVATLSDLAAMGGRALGVVVAICARPDADIEAIERGAIEACVASGCIVLGGNLSTSATTTVVVAGLGVAPPGGAVGRFGAHEGDHLFVTSALGAASAGRRARHDGAALDDALVVAHRRPVPRLAEGAVAARCGASAMIDVSDGLARDLRRLAASSRVGVELDDVPVAEGATFDEALGGGEDYELVIAHGDPDALVAAFESLGLTVPIEIGRVVAEGSGVTVRGEPMADVGWRHGAPNEDQEGR
jgi:thiamine-monophosphate kinase